MNVTRRIAAIKQPYGGYIKPSNFEQTIVNDGSTLNPEENIHASLIGMAVDYLSRYMTGSDIKDAFHISLNGSIIAEKYGLDGSFDSAAVYAARIRKCLDDTSIICACKLVSFDVWVRNILEAPLAKRHDVIDPDKYTIENIRIMVERSVRFIKTYGPVTKDGFNFLPENANQKDIKTFTEKCLRGKKAVLGGYTNTVDSGDGDFLTADTLWDFKVSKSKPTSKHTLQLLMYLIMGLHSGRDEFMDISKLGIFNPRLNCVYRYDVYKIPDEVIKEVEDIVIGY